MEVGQGRAPCWNACPCATSSQAQWAPFESLARERGIDFENRVPAQLEGLSDLGLLGIVLGNLLNNAASFAESGSVRASAEAQGETLSLKISNRTRQAHVERLGAPERTLLAQRRRPHESPTQRTGPDPGSVRQCGARTPNELRAPGGPLRREHRAADVKAPPRCRRQTRGRTERPPGLSEDRARSPGRGLRACRAA